MEWTTQKSWGEPIPFWRFDDVAFSGDTLVAAHQTGFVLRIPVWTGAVQRAGLGLGPDVKLRCLSFTGDGQTGYLGLLRIDYKADGIPRFFTTRDGGLSWSPSDPVDSAGNAVGPWHGLCGLSAIDDTVWAVGTYFSHETVSGHVHKAAAIVSHDRGATWQVRFDGAKSLIDVYFSTPSDGLIVGETVDGFPGFWTTSNAGTSWSEVPLPDAALKEARGWKIGRDGHGGNSVAVTIAARTPNTRLLLTEDFRRHDRWRSVVVDLEPDEVMDHQLAGIGWMNGMHWVGVNGRALFESADLVHWSKSQLSGAGDLLKNVNRIIRGPDGCLYAAGENLYRYA